MNRYPVGSLTIRSHWLVKERGKHMMTWTMQAEYPGDKRPELYLNDPLEPEGWTETFEELVRRFKWIGLSPMPAMTPHNSGIKSILTGAYLERIWYWDNQSHHLTFISTDDDAVFWRIRYSHPVVETQKFMDLWRIRELLAIDELRKRFRSGS